MKVNGIIAEYNPFHNGHQYHLDDARKRNQADYTIVVMSGNFVQRGTPALLDKYKRAAMALSCGADLILELPISYSVSSAEYFAMGSVTLLDKLGVVDNLCFGSECGNLKVLQKMARILGQEPEAYVSNLKNQLKEGHSYPNARTWALIQYDPSLSESKDVLSTPNNILGIEYLKALTRRKSAIMPDTCLRMGSDYRDKWMGEYQSSALALRQAIYSGQDVEAVKNQMPEAAYAILADALKQSPPLTLDDFSGVLHYKLLQEKDQGYDRYLDVSSDLSDRIRKHLYQFTGFQNFCDVLKSKDVTYTRVSRCLLHILLGLTDEMVASIKALDYIPYARVLGLRQSASPLLSEIKEKASVPIITKLADAGSVLDEKAFSMLQNEIKMNEIFLSASAIKSGKPAANELATPIAVI